MSVELAVTSFVALFVVIDPIGLAPLFVALTAGMDARARHRIAVRAILISAGLLALFGWAGETILATIGIGLPAFRVAGGMLLFLTALDMLFERRTERRGKSAGIERDDPSVFPLATPLIAGPGALAAMILLIGQNPGDLPAQFTILGMMLVVLAITYILFLTSAVIERGLGPTGIAVITRLLGMLLAALSVQFVLDGLADFGLIPGAG